MSLDMNPEIRGQWCAALRSGEYEQVKEALRLDDDGGEPIGYCCLGVLTDLYLKAGNPEEFDDLGWQSGVWDCDSVLAPPVRAWAGLSEANPQLTPSSAAAELNDEGSTFTEIADLIDGGAA